MQGRFAVIGIVALAFAIEVPFMAQDTATAAPTGMKCPGRNLATDDWNCGACGNTCQHDSHCREGHCLCGDGRPLCGGELGQCCGDNERCSQGKCITSCRAPLAQCKAASGGEYCRDLQTDNQNCGACNNACPSGSECHAGACGCAAEHASCDGVCIWTTWDALDCGRCGKRCGKNAMCDQGTCRTCARKETLCAGEQQPMVRKYVYCANLHEDNANCGKCGHQGPGRLSCVNGHCEP